MYVHHVSKGHTNRQSALIIVRCAPMEHILILRGFHPRINAQHVLGKLHLFLELKPLCPAGVLLAMKVRAAVTVCSADQVHLSYFQGHLTALFVVKEHIPMPQVQHFAVSVRMVRFRVLLVHLIVKIALVAR
jgi:hypothetical protein